MTFALMLLFVATLQLDGVPAARGEIDAVPFAGMGGATGDVGAGRRQRQGNVVARAFGGIKQGWNVLMARFVEYLELWTAAKDDKTIAWTLGIGWACCGGGLAGATLVFAKAT